MINCGRVMRECSLVAKGTAVVCLFMLVSECAGQQDGGREREWVINGKRRSSLNTCKPFTRNCSVSCDTCHMSKN